MFLPLVYVLFSFLSYTHYQYKTTPYILEYDSTLLPKPNIPANNPLTVEGVALGRLLFYDSLLSVNNKQSCGSCHKQQFSFTDAGNSVSLGTLKIPGDFNTMPLVNLAWETHFFWNGRANSLEEQVLEPIQKHNEMAKDLSVLVRELTIHKYYPKLFKAAFPNDKNAISVINISRALSQFIRTIYIPPKPISYRGFKDIILPDSINKDKTFIAFATMSKMCANCHSSVLYSSTNGQLLSNGINYYDKDTNNDNQKFKAPPLINLEYTAPYMHDGRFNTLYEVLDHYDQHIGELNIYNPDIFEKKIDNTFNESEKDEMVKFLLSLKDTTILTNKIYSNPFAKVNFDWNDFPKYE